MFELVSPFNRVVVPYKDIELYLIGCREKKTQKEYDVMFIQNMKEKLQELEVSTNEMIQFYDEIKRPKVYPLRDLNITEVQNIVAQFDANNEGIVVCDDKFNRVKVKGSAYLAIHRLKDNNGQLSVEHILKCIQNETVDDVIGMFPEYQEVIQDVVNLYKQLSWKLKSVIEHGFVLLRFLKDCDDLDDKDKKKKYAMEVKDSAFSKIYFDCWKYEDEEKASVIISEFMSKLDYDMLKKYANAHCVDLRTKKERIDAEN
jgi:hypothetical protein